MKPLRILALVPEGHIPPDSLRNLKPEQVERIKMEYDVLWALEHLGHETRCVDVTTDLTRVRQAILEYGPRLVFNMLEDFHGIAIYDHNLVSFLELMKLKYTGCNPRGLLLARDKALSKKILAYHRIRVPRFQVFPIGRRIRRPRWLRFPILVKSVIEESSTGIAQASVVRSDRQLEERVAFVHENVGTDAIAEEYIEGRELYVGILGNQRLQTLPIWELVFTNLREGAPKIATHRVKWSLRYQKQAGVKTRHADLDEATAARVARICKKVYRVLQLSGYARIDLRLTEDGRVVILEANPNPDLSQDEEYALSAKAGGIPYSRLIQRIVNLGCRYRPVGLGVRG